MLTPREEAAFENFKKQLKVTEFDFDSGSFFNSIAGRICRDAFIWGLAYGEKFQKDDSANANTAS